MGAASEPPTTRTVTTSGPSAARRQLGILTEIESGLHPLGTTVLARPLIYRRLDGEAGPYLNRSGELDGGLLELVKAGVAWFMVPRGLCFPIQPAMERLDAIRHPAIST